jgi:hypothetical protein
MRAITIQIPDEVADRLEAEAQARRITLEAVIEDRVLAMQQPDHHPSTPPGFYGSFWGAAKGKPGAHGSFDAVEKYIGNVRSEWQPAQ